MLPFLLFAVVAAVTPGPSNVMLVAAGAQAGIVRGLPCLFGVTSGMAVMMFLVPLGLGSLVLKYPLVLRALHWGGAAVLLWLSWKIATSPSPGESAAGGHGDAAAGGRVEAAAGPEPIGYAGALLFQWVNPKSWLVSASAAGTFLSGAAGSPFREAAALGGLFVLAALPSGLVWLAFGAGVQHLLHEPRRLRAFNLIMGALLALSIVLIAR